MAEQEFWQLIATSASGGGLPFRSVIRALERVQKTAHEARCFAANLARTGCIGRSSPCALLVPL